MSEVSQGRSKEDAQDPQVGPADPEARDQPGGQERPMNEDETLDEALEETFPASDPVTAKRIDGPDD